MLDKYKSLNGATKSAVLAGFVLLVIVLSKVGVDGWGQFKEWRAEQARIAAQEAEQRKLAEAEARKLRGEIETTTITLNEMLKSVKDGENPEDYAGKYQDAWGTDVKLLKLGSRKGWRVVSAGPDGEFNTTDDVKREDSSFSIGGALFGSDDEEIKVEVEVPKVEEEPYEEPEEKESLWRRFSPF